jgi:hypothetical protein
VSHVPLGRREERTAFVALVATDSMECFAPAAPQPRVGRSRADEDRTGLEHAVDLEDGSKVVFDVIELSERRNAVD